MGNAINAFLAWVYPHNKDLEFEDLLKEYNQAVQQEQEMTKTEHYKYLLSSDVVGSDTDAEYYTVLR